MKSARTTVPHGNPVSYLEPRNIAQGDLLLSKITIESKIRFYPGPLPKNGFPGNANDRHIRSEMKGIIHLINPRADPNNTSAQAGYVLNSRLEHSIVLTNEIPL
jgi:hypothetical protein